MFLVWRKPAAREVSLRTLAAPVPSAGRVHRPAAKAELGFHSLSKAPHSEVFICTLQTWQNAEILPLRVRTSCAPWHAESNLIHRDMEFEKTDHWSSCSLQSGKADQHSITPAPVPVFPRGEGPRKTVRQAVSSIGAAGVRRGLSRGCAPPAETEGWKPLCVDVILSLSPLWAVK